MADIADKKLDDTAIAYLSLDANDVVHSAAMSKSMTSAEIASIDTFMKTAPLETTPYICLRVIAHPV